MITIYTTPQDIRDLLGLTIDDAPDMILEEFIEKAQNVVVHYIQVPVKHEEVVLDSDGTMIELENRFIADTNFDQEIDNEDIQVYGWTDANDFGTASTLAVSTIYPEHGVIKLASSASSYGKVTVNYSYYTCAIDWNLLALATAYYAGMLWVAREEFLVPDELTIGNVRVRQKQPWDKLRTEFLRIIFHLTEIPMDLVNYRKIMVSARSTGAYTGPGTVLSDEDTASDKNIRDPEAQ